MNTSNFGILHDDLQQCAIDNANNESERNSCNYSRRMDEYVPDCQEEIVKPPEPAVAEPGGVAIQMNALNPQMRSNTASSLKHPRSGSA